MSSRNPLPPITCSSVVTPIDTSRFFDEAYSESRTSPIDQYIQNTSNINVFAYSLGANSNNGTKISSIGQSTHIGSILFLGYMSAIESYFRALFRNIILIDEVAQRTVEKNEVSYAAAMHHNKLILPEALFEGMSFASTNTVKESIKDFLGIKGGVSADVDKVLDEYSKVCSMRHCCVHRFGKLGAKNASDLGLDNHSRFLEKPIKLTPSELEEIADILLSVVLTINRFIYEKLLERMAKNKDDKGKQYYPMDWRWHYNSDKKRFLKYYHLFYTVSHSSPSPPAKNIYDEYRANYKK